MSTRIETIKQREAVEKKDAKAKSTEVVKIVNFDAVRFRAPFTLRCAALLIDYLLLVLPLAINVLMIPIGTKRGRSFGLQIDTFGWLIVLLIFLTNFIILPVFFGRTIGKAAVGLRISARNGDNLSLAAALIRHLVGYPLTILTAGIGFLLAILNVEGRALHDYLAGTIVVQAARRKQIKN